MRAELHGDARSGPAPGSAKSMLRVWSKGAWNGWSKYTLAEVTGIQPCGPLALPAISVATVR